MPDANGRFRGITVPELPWLKEKPSATPRPKNGGTNRDKRPTQT